jgi:hypothetical protein
VRLRDPPVAAYLVTKIESLWDAVVGLHLSARLELSDFGKPFGREQSSLNREGLEGKLSLANPALALGDHCSS